MKQIEWMNEWMSGAWSVDRHKKKVVNIEKPKCQALPAKREIQTDEMSSIKMHEIK